MMRLTRHRTPRVLWHAIIFLSLLVPARAEERIFDYHADISMQPDASLLVRETVRVRAEHAQIRHGIYRDFPTRYRDRLGNAYKVDFRIVNARRDGSDEPYHTEWKGTGVRIYLGSKNGLVPLGVHTYELTYTATREVGFFADHDELYWNVTGNGWIFPIDHASATVHLPRVVSASELRFDAFTGAQGMRGKDFRAMRMNNGEVSFATTLPLAPQQGLTIVVGIPKGVVAEPTATDQALWVLQDNASALAGLIGLGILLVYYVFVWMRVGRDPRPGTIVVRYEPPRALSPAAMRYLEKMSFDDRTFAAAVLNMAVKGYLTIREDGDKYVLTRRSGSTPLSAEEKVAADRLFLAGDEIKLETANHAYISAALAELRKLLKNTENKVYFVTNQLYLLPGIIFSILTVLAMWAFLPGSESKSGAGSLMVWLTPWSAVVYVLFSQAAHAWQGVRSGAHRAAHIATALRATWFAAVFAFFELFALGVFIYFTSVIVALVLMGVLVLNVLFHHLLKAPTSAGRKLLDEITGFKEYLGAVHGDQLQRLNPPDKTPALFERYLPYALALGVEQAWAQQFSAVLAQAAQATGGRAGYTPGWYSGSNWNALNVGNFADSFGSGFSSAIASSAAAPGSSSGFSGGSSGGGGGGGGGGGW